MGESATRTEGKTFTHFLTLDSPQDDWARQFQRKTSILQRGLRALFPAGMATPLTPLYVPVAQFYVEKEGDILRILQGITNAVNKLAELVNMKHGGIIATLEDVEMAGSTAFTPVHLGLSCMRIPAPKACSGNDSG